MAWTSLWHWVVGRPRGGPVRLVAEPPHLGRQAVDIPLDGRIGTVGPGLVLSDRFAPDQICDVVDFASRSQLPVEAWVVRGAEAMPWRPIRVARWVRRLHRAAAGTRVVVVLDRCDGRDRNRIAAHLRRMLGRDTLEVGWT